MINPSPATTAPPAASEALRAWGEQFVAATDPIDLWLVTDGNYVRSATKQESELATRLPLIADVVEAAERASTRVHISSEVLPLRVTDAIKAQDQALEALRDSLGAEG